MFLCVLVRPGFGLKKKKFEACREKKTVVGGGGVALQWSLQGDDGGFMLFMLMSLCIICFAHAAAYFKHIQREKRENTKKIRIVNPAFSSQTVLAYF